MISPKFMATLALCSALIFSLSIVSSASAADKSALSSLAEQAGAVIESGDLGEIINVNSATPEMLASIPGIGPELGKAITAYRDANGAFSGIKDLLNVEGIDMNLLEKIKPFLKF